MKGLCAITQQHNWRGWRDGIFDMNEFHPHTESHLERSGEVLLNQFCAEFGVRMNVALEMFTWFDENCGEPNGADSGDLRALAGKTRDAFHVLVSYQDSQKKVKHLRMSTRVMALALGYSTAAGAEESSAVGKKLGIIKATVSQCLNHFNEQLGLPPLPGQRDETARRNMVTAREKNLRK